MPAILSFVGPHKSGKTTLICELVQRFTQEGVKVGVVKSTKEDAGDVDREGSDTWRFREAGAETVVLFGRKLLTSFLRAPGRERFLHEVFLRCGDCELVFVEGFKSISFLPKVEVVKEGQGLLLDQGLEGVIAVVSKERISRGVPHFFPHEVGALKGFIEERFLKRRPLEVELFVDGVSVGLTRYVREALSGTIFGFLASLRGVPEGFECVELRIRRRRYERGAPS